MPSQRARIIILSLILSLLIFATAWFLYMEPYDKEIDLGYSDKAILNPYLAATQYLKKSGDNVKTLQYIESVSSLSPYTTVFVSHAGKVISPQQADELMTWMEQGGHMIIAAPSNVDNDPLLSKFHISRKGYFDRQLEAMQNELDKEDELVVETDEDEEPETVELTDDNESVEEPDTENDQQDCACSDDQLSILTFDGLDHKFTINFTNDDGFIHPYINGDDQEKEADQVDYLIPSYWVYDQDDQLQFLQFHIGEGLISIIGSSTLWQNEAIHQYDHAFLLTTLTDHSDEILILYGSMMPGLTDLIWQFGYEFVISGALLIFLSMWYFGQRFGPKILAGTQTRRSYNEQLAATSQYLWRTKNQFLLIKSIREDIFIRLKFLLTDEEFSQQETICQFLESKLSIDKQLIEEALFGQVEHKEKPFVSCIQLLKHINNHL